MEKLKYPIIGLSGKAGSGKSTAASILGGPAVALADPLKRFLYQAGASDEALWGESRLREHPVDVCWQDQNWNDLTEEFALMVLGKENPVSMTTPRLIESPRYKNKQYIKEQLNGKFKNNPTLTTRGALTFLGDLGRRFNPDVWINIGILTAKTLLTTPCRYIPVQGVIYTTGSPNTNFVIIPDLRFRNELLAIKELGGQIIRVTKPKQGDEKESYHLSETELDTVPSFWYDHVLVNNGNLDRFKTDIETLRFELL